MRMRMRPKNPARASLTMVPFDWVNEECGRTVDVAVEGAGIMKEGSELEGGRGVGVSDVVLDDGKRQYLARLDDLTLPLAHLTEDND
jgi:hypothetical protein